MGETKPKADSDGSIADPNVYLLIRLLSGARFVAHMCFERPKDRRDIARVSLGPGVVTAEGGRFRITRSGWIDCIAYIVEGRLVVTYPSVRGYAREGEKAKIGPITPSAR
jgi:hypothetical protein